MRKKINVTWITLTRLWGETNHGIEGIDRNGVIEKKMHGGSHSDSPILNDSNLDESFTSPLSHKQNSSHIDKGRSD